MTEVDEMEEVSQNVWNKGLQMSMEISSKKEELEELINQLQDLFQHDMRAHMASIALLNEMHRCKLQNGVKEEDEAQKNVEDLADIANETAAYFRLTRAQSCAPPSQVWEEAYMLAENLLERIILSEETCEWLTLTPCVPTDGQVAAAEALLRQETASAQPFALPHTIGSIPGLDFFAAFTGALQCTVEVLLTRKHLFSVIEMESHSQEQSEDWLYYNFPTLYRILERLNVLRLIDSGETIQEVLKRLNNFIVYGVSEGVTGRKNKPRAIQGASKADSRAQAMAAAAEDAEKEEHPPGLQEIPKFISFAHVTETTEAEKALKTCDEMLRFFEKKFQGFEAVKKKYFAWMQYFRAQNVLSEEDAIVLTQFLREDLKNIFHYDLDQKMKKLQALIYAHCQNKLRTVNNEGVWRFNNIRKPSELAIPAGAMVAQIAFQKYEELKREMEGQEENEDIEPAFSNSTESEKKDNLSEEVEPITNFSIENSFFFQDANDSYTDPSKALISPQIHTGWHRPEKRTVDSVYSDLYTFSECDHATKDPLVDGNRLCAHCNQLITEMKTYKQRQFKNLYKIK